MSLKRPFRPGAILSAILVTGWLAVALAPIPAIAEDKPQEAQKVGGDSSSGFTLKVPVEVVVVNAIVTDRDGNPITDLTVERFRGLSKTARSRPFSRFSRNSTIARKAP